MFEKLFKALNLKTKRIDGDPTDLKIDAELLCCPVCFELFSDSPHVIPCGHTLCGNCLSRLTGRGSGNNSSFQCPMCRKSFAKNRRYPKNYMVESILSSIDAWIDNDVSNENSNKNSERIAVGRLKKRLDESMAENSKLKTEIKNIKQHHSKRIFLTSLLVGVLSLIAARIFFF